MLANWPQTKQLASLVFTGIQAKVYTTLQMETKVETSVKPVKWVSNLELMNMATRYKGNDLHSFIDTLQCMSDRLQIRPDWMLKVMLQESGLNPKAQNSIGATGLIQFKPETAIGLGTTTAELARMSGTEQLYYIEKFWTPAKGKVNNYTDLRMYNLFPIAIGQPDEFIFESKNLTAFTVASNNPSFDLDGDMQITVKEFKQKVSHE